MSSSPLYRLAPLVFVFAVCLNASASPYFEFVANRVALTALPKAGVLAVLPLSGHWQAAMFVVLPLHNQQAMLQPLHVFVDGVCSGLPAEACLKDEHAARQAFVQRGITCSSQNIAHRRGVLCVAPPQEVTWLLARGKTIIEAVSTSPDAEAYSIVVAGNVSYAAAIAAANRYYPTGGAEGLNRCTPVGDMAATQSLEVLAATIADSALAAQNLAKGLLEGWFVELIPDREELEGLE